MKKEEIIRKFGKEAWKKKLAQKRARYKVHKEEVKAAVRKYQEEHSEEEKARSKKYREEHPEQVKANSHEASRKGGKQYAKRLIYSHTGLQGARNIIRMLHARLYHQYKRFIDPHGLSQIHHEWIPETSKYSGVALVEADQHMHGFIDVIQILEGKITLFTEEEIRGE